MSKKSLSRKSIIDKKVKELENIVQNFEKGEIGIEKGIEEYKRASKLIQAIKKQLTELELKIEEIRNSH